VDEQSAHHRGEAVAKPEAGTKSYFVIDSLTPADRGYAFFSTKSFEDNADVLLSIVLLSGLAFYVTDNRFRISLGTHRNALFSLVHPDADMVLTRS
jgi:hypothetical protein